MVKFQQRYEKRHGIYRQPKMDLALSKERAMAVKQLLVKERPAPQEKSPPKAMARESRLRRTRILTAAKVPKAARRTGASRFTVEKQLAAAF
jgi:hypothetical protein